MSSSPSEASLIQLLLATRLNSNSLSCCLAASEPGSPASTRPCWSEGQGWLELSGSRTSTLATDRL